MSDLQSHVILSLLFVMLYDNKINNYKFINTLIRKLMMTPYLYFNPTTVSGN